MANEATAELYTRQSGLNKAKFKTDYDQYLADLATKYGISFDNLNTNLEARGILRSGEAGTARTRLGSAEEAARTSAQSDYDYNVASEDINLATRLAGLMAGGGSGGGGTGGTRATPATPATVPMYRSPLDPAYDGMRDRGPRPGNFNVNAAAGLAGQPINATPRPSFNVNAAAGLAGQPINATPRPSFNVNAAAGLAGQPINATPTRAPALPDLSGVDFAGLGRMIEANKIKRKEDNDRVYGYTPPRPTRSGNR